MSLSRIAEWVATALGSGTAGAGLSGWVNRRKIRAETTRTDAEAIRTVAEAKKIEAEAAATRTGTAEHLVAMLRADLDRQAAELARLRAELAAVRAVAEECKAHRRADRLELAEVKAANAGLTRRLDDLTRDMHRTATGDAR